MSTLFFFFVFTVLDNTRTLMESFWCTCRFVTGVGGWCVCSGWYEWLLEIVVSVFSFLLRCITREHWLNRSSIWVDYFLSWVKGSVFFGKIWRSVWNNCLGYYYYFFHFYCSGWHGIIAWFDWMLEIGIFFLFSISAILDDKGTLIESFRCTCRLLTFVDGMTLFSGW